MQTAGVRGLGGGFVGVTAALFAAHLGMPEWKIGAVLLLVSLGLQMLVSDRTYDQVVALREAPPSVRGHP